MMDSLSRRISATIWATLMGWVTKGVPSRRICSPWCSLAYS